MIMRYFLFYITLFILAAVLGVYFLIPPSLSQYKHITIDCRIYDLEGNVIRNYSGFSCVFFRDGSFIHIAPSHNELIKVGRKNEKLWSLKFPSAIEFLSLDNRQNIIISTQNSTGFKIVKVTPYGKISTSFDLGTKQAVSLRQIKFDIWQDTKRVAPKDSYILIQRDRSNEPIVLDHDLSRVLFQFNLEKRSYQDLQLISSEELIFFESGPMLLESIIPFIPSKRFGEWSIVKLFNLNSRTEKRYYVFRNISPAQGSVQFLKRNLFLITQQIKDSDKKKISFFSEDHGVFKRFVVDDVRGNARAEDLSAFLNLNRQSANL